MTVVASRREQILDAAISVLGRQGVRACTHRAVDDAAGLPTGSTSNYFRSRDALLDGVVERLAAVEMALWERIAATTLPRTPAELAAALAVFVRDATGPHRTLTLARFAMFVEAGVRPATGEGLAAAASRIREWGAQWLRAVGSADPARDARIVLDQLDGLILHQLAVPDPGFDPADRLTALVTALTRGL